MSPTLIPNAALVDPTGPRDRRGGLAAATSADVSSVATTRPIRRQVRRTVGGSAPRPAGHQYGHPVTARLGACVAVSGADRRATPTESWAAARAHNLGAPRRRSQCTAALSSEGARENASARRRPGAPRVLSRAGPRTEQPRARPPVTGPDPQVGIPSPQHHQPGSWRKRMSSSPHTLRKCRASPGGPQKNTSTSSGACSVRIADSSRRQSGCPMRVFVRRPVT